MKFKSGTRRRALEYEKDWVQRWKQDNTFEKSVENRSKDNSYVFSETKSIPKRSHLFFFGLIARTSIVGGIIE